MRVCLMALAMLLCSCTGARYDPAQPRPFEIKVKSLYPGSTQSTMAQVETPWFGKISLHGTLPTYEVLVVLSIDGEPFHWATSVLKTREIIFYYRLSPEECVMRCGRERYIDPFNQMQSESPMSMQDASEDTEPRISLRAEIKDFVLDEKGKIHPGKVLAHSNIRLSLECHQYCMEQ